MNVAYILAPFGAWVVAQGAKYIIAQIRNDDGKSKIAQLYLSGGMPSAHSASTVALTTFIALKDSMESGLFAVSLLFTAIVIYDAMMVRRTVGDQGVFLEDIAKTLKNNKVLKAPRITRGHTPLEVAVGMILGMLFGAIVFFATK